MKSGPGRLLLELVLVAVALGGLAFGVHWKRKAGPGDALSNDKQIMELYRKIEKLESINDMLLERIDELEEKL